MNCAEAIDALVKAQCGLAFVTFMMSQERLRQAGPKAVYRCDISAGFTTASGYAERASNYIFGEAGKQAMSISRSAHALAREVRGKEKRLKAVEVQRIGTKALVLAGRMEKLLYAVKRSCGSSKKAKVGSSCGRC